MNQSVADLLVRYSRAIGGKGSQNPALVDGYNTLRLADAALDKVSLNNSDPQHPLQIVVIGPTQAGKSTLCNIILDSNVAGISALAGYTVHAQGFAVGTEDAQLSPLTKLMLPLTRVHSSELRADNLNHYLLESVQPGKDSLIKKGVVWDSPDFDSIESSGYRGAVLQAVAMADILVLMVSKDKYADKSVWDMLRLVRRLGKPLFVCINKLDAKDHQTVVDSFRQRHEEQFEQSAPDIVALPFVKETTFDADTRAKLSATLEHCTDQLDRSAQQQHVEKFVEHHWPKWMAPIELENDARNNWLQTVDNAIADAKERYATRYLNNPQKYDTFNRAIAELLTLLEIPGLAGTLSATRNLVTWPARKLFGIGRSVVESDSQPANQELEMLDLIFEQTLTTVQGHILVQQQEAEDTQAYWSSMQKTITQQKSAIRESYTTRAMEIQQEFEPKIDAAAQQLYEQLQDQPALLNTLRAARVSTDAAAVVLAVKSGGLAAADLILAPAMLSVTTLLTESVLGQYMERTKNQLKSEQQALIDSALLEKELGDRLAALNRELDNDQLLLAGHGPLPDFSLNKSVS